DLGFWPAQSEIYRNWSGRYSSSLIIFFLWWTDSVPLYRLVHAFLFLFSVFSCFFLFERLLPSDTPRRTPIAAAIIFSALFFAGTPSLVEAAYWMGGAEMYHFSTSLSLIIVGALLSPRTILHERVDHFLLAFCILIIAGSNEISMLLLILILAAATLFRSLRSGRVDRRSALLLGLAVLFSLGVILAPGNAARSLSFTHHHDLLFSAGATTALLLFLVPLWLINPLLWICSALYLWWRATGAPALTLPAHRRIPMAILFLVLMAGTVFPSFWAAGVPPSGRHLNITYAIFLLFWLYLLETVMLPWITAKFPMHPRFYGRAILVALTFFILYSVLIASIPRQKEWSHDIEQYLAEPSRAVAYLLSHYARNNLTDAFSDLVTLRALRYDRTLTARYRFIADCPAAGPCTVPEVADPPPSIFFRDITADPGDWKNVCYARYFDKERIFIISE
ncbi:MAG TPA: DUF6056 family protein, partial [bacterium]|nr:DUF6056 family protein [bacterium]